MISNEFTVKSLTITGEGRKLAIECNDTCISYKYAVESGQRVEWVKLQVYYLDRATLTPGSIEL